MHRRYSQGRSLRLRFVIFSRSGTPYWCEVRIDTDGEFRSLAMRRFAPGVEYPRIARRCGTRSASFELAGNPWDSTDGPVRLH